MASLSFQEDRLELFPTLVFRRLHEGVEGVNARLRELCLAEVAAGEGLVRSNVGGFHGAPDLLSRQDPALTVLQSMLEAAVLDYVAEVAEAPSEDLQLELKLEAWINVQTAGAYARPHAHPGSHLASVYYVDPGEEASGTAGSAATAGRLDVLDPRGRMNQLPIPGVPELDNVSFRPKAGLLLLFPAWLQHMTHPYAGQTPRVSIACNVNVVRFARKLRRS